MKIVGVWRIGLFIFLTGLINQYAIAANKVALVIGNNAYPEAKLNLARQDAKNIGKTLQDIGFKVIHASNADWNEKIIFAIAHYLHDSHHEIEKEFYQKLFYLEQSKTSVR